MDVLKVNHDAALMFEKPFIQVPHEQFRKFFKTSQRHIERDFTSLQKEANEAVKTQPQGAAAAKLIDGMINRVEGLKRKLSDLQTNSTTPSHAAMRRRLNHLAEFESLTSTDQPEFSEWADIRLDRWLVDWSLRNGMEHTAKAIAQAKGIENLVEVDLFSDIHRVEEALRRHNCSEALMWCSQNKTALTKMKSTLEFDLRQQEFVELVRANKSAEAMAYSRKYFSPYLETHGKEVTHCMGLLACGPDTSLRGYQRFYDPSRWEHLIQMFRAVAYSLNSLPTEPLLNLALYAGIASLKLPSCYDSQSKNLDCPVCDDRGLGVLSKGVPVSHHVNSTIVCRISGRIMNENNPPMCFPNGYVYSEEALNEMAARNNGTVVCPRSGFSCRLSELRKVYIT
ncbi:GID complex subunit containing RING finger motif [Tulasnella sp. JGI-2019a]|nr:GID complex subunit containing RING finger motif [Tulasnella sp. JGI-2019a]KAG9009026.1 GID complex subunit containing RING finger motif [Tulasnella sp. JGI-2019a]KAG9035997.1 GID complex subunit containing RING finger motif [Tulasnella sp. JGI-2019a]